MSPIQIPINGTETSELVQTPEQQVLALFYRAFNTRSMALMQTSWLQTNEVSMDNPIGGIRRGWAEIAGGYDRIFTGQAEVYVEFYDYTVHGSDTVFFATGRERGYFRTATESVELAIRTTRIFVNHDGNWKQIHHHGSIDAPDLLHRYQQAIRKP